MNSLNLIENYLNLCRKFNFFRFPGKIPDEKEIFFDKFFSTVGRKNPFLEHLNETNQIGLIFLLIFNS
jgi:hypothetical protein